MGYVTHIPQQKGPGFERAKIGTYYGLCLCGQPGPSKGDPYSVAAKEGPGEKKT